MCGRFHRNGQRVVGIWGLGPDVEFRFRGWRGDVRLQLGAQEGKEAGAEERPPDGACGGKQGMAAGVEVGGGGEGRAGAALGVPQLGGIRRGRAARGTGRGGSGARW